MEVGVGTPSVGVVELNMGDGEEEISNIGKARERMLSMGAIGDASYGKDRIVANEGNMWSNSQDQSSQNGRLGVVSCKPLPKPIARNKISNICMLAINVGNWSKFDLKWWVQNVGFENNFKCWMWIRLRMLGVYLNICWMQNMIKNIGWFSKFKISEFLSLNWFLINLSSLSIFMYWRIWLGRGGVRI